MKRGLTIVLLGSLLLVTLSGCFLLNEFEETTLTFVNGSEEDITGISLGNGYSGRAPSGYISHNNVLEDGDLEHGDELLLSLNPVLHEDSQAVLGISTGDGEYGTGFTYEEGAEVVIIFDTTAGDNYEDWFSIEEGKLVSLYK